MPKGKKTVIKEIKRLENNEISINGKEYVILEDVEDIEKAITMKVTSHGNRILRFEDLKIKATIDVKRIIKIVKYTFQDIHRAKRFRVSFEKSIVTDHDSIETVNTATSHIFARKIISDYVTKGSDTYDKESPRTTVYVSYEQK